MTVACASCSSWQIVHSREFDSKHLHKHSSMTMHKCCDRFIWMPTIYREALWDKKKNEHKSQPPPCVSPRIGKPNQTSNISYNIFSAISSSTTSFNCNRLNFSCRHRRGRLDDQHQRRSKAQLSIWKLTSSSDCSCIIGHRYSNGLRRIRETQLFHRTWAAYALNIDGHLSSFETNRTKN